MEIILNAAFGRKPVVIPAHGIENIHATHSLIANDDIRLCIGEHVSDMQRSRGGRRRRVDDECFFARPRSVVVVHTVTLPDRIPSRLDLTGVEMLRQARRIDRSCARPRGGSTLGLELAHLGLFRWPHFPRLGFSCRCLGSVGARAGASIVQLSRRSCGRAGVPKLVCRGHRVKLRPGLGHGTRESTPIRCPQGIPADFSSRARDILVSSACDGRAGPVLFRASNGPRASRE